MVTLHTTQGSEEILRFLMSILFKKVTIFLQRVADPVPDRDIAVMLLKNLAVRIAVVKLHLRIVVIKMRHIGIRVTGRIRTAAAERLKRHIAEFLLQLKESAQNLVIILLGILPIALPHSGHSMRVVR